MSVSPRVGTTSNLSADGTYDLLLIKFQDGFPESQLTFDIDETPRKVTGIQKVAQMFLKILFTSKGSNVLYPSQGTDFSALTINANHTSNNTVFISELSSQVRSAESQTKGILGSSKADLDSQLDTITILGLDTSKESVVMYLRLLTKSGAKAQVAVPFPTLDMKMSQT